MGWRTRLLLLLLISDILIGVPLELDHILHHRGEAPRHCEQIVGKDVREVAWSGNSFYDVVAATDVVVHAFTLD